MPCVPTPWPLGRTLLNLLQHIQPFWYKGSQNWMWYSKRNPICKEMNNFILVDIFTSKHDWLYLQILVKFVHQDHEDIFMKQDSCLCSPLQFISSDYCMIMWLMWSLHIADILSSISTSIPNLETSKNSVIVYSIYPILSLRSLLKTLENYLE